jgi:hypothetical protein
MTDRRVLDTRDADDARSSASSWMLGAGVLLAVGAAAAWWLLRAGEAPRPPDPPAATARGGHTYLAAEHVDPDSARLEKRADGTSVVTLVLRDVKDDETVHARWTDPGPADPGGPQVFLDVRKPPHEVGVLEVTSAPGKAPGERALTIVLPKPFERVTVIDLRWNGGRREGFEVSASPATPPK